MSFLERLKRMLRTSGPRRARAEAATVHRPGRSRAEGAAQPREPNIAHWGKVYAAVRAEFGPPNVWLRPSGERTSAPVESLMDARIEYVAGVDIAEVYQLEEVRLIGWALAEALLKETCAVGCGSENEFGHAGAWFSNEFRRDLGRKTAMECTSRGLPPEAASELSEQFAIRCIERLYGTEAGARSIALLAQAGWIVVGGDPHGPDPVVRVG